MNETYKNISSFNIFCVDRELIPLANVGQKEELPSFETATVHHQLLAHNHQAQLRKCKSTAQEDTARLRITIESGMELLTQTIAEDLNRLQSLQVVSNMMRSGFREDLEDMVQVGKQCLHIFTFIFVDAMYMYILQMLRLYYSNKMVRLLLPSFK